MNRLRVYWVLNCFVDNVACTLTLNTQEEIWHISHPLTEGVNTGFYIEHEGSIICKYKNETIIQIHDINFATTGLGSTGTLTSTHCTTAHWSLDKDD